MTIDPIQRTSSHQLDEIDADDRDLQVESSFLPDEIKIEDREVRNRSDRLVLGAVKVTIVEDAKEGNPYFIPVYYNE